MPLEESGKRIIHTHPHGGRVYVAGDTFTILDELGKSPNEADALVMAFWYLDVVIGLGMV